ncbi:MAG: hypothetical protein ACRCWE_17190, partial [Stenotrophomonas maltophilia]
MSSAAPRRPSPKPPSRPTARPRPEPPAPARGQNHRQHPSRRPDWQNIGFCRSAKPTMRLSQFHLHTTKETPSDAELTSHRLMLRAGMIRKLASGLYTWSPL